MHWLTGNMTWRGLRSARSPRRRPGGATADTSQSDSVPEGGQKMSADDVRQQVQRMRALPVEHVLGDALFALLNAAQVKLGRRDARLLIDVSAVAHEHARAYLPATLTNEIDQALGQLRMGQVSAEGQATGPEENDLDRVPSAPSVGAARSSADRAPGTP